jgi:hypothetical protein
MKKVLLPKKKTNKPLMRSDICEQFLKHNEVNCCSIITENDDGSFNPYGCDCCSSLATNTYECHGYAPKTKEVLGLGSICGDCICYFYNGADEIMGAAS